MAILVGSGFLGVLSVSGVDVPHIQNWPAPETLQAWDGPPSADVPAEPPKEAQGPILHVPRVFVARLPGRLADETDVEARKTLFIRTVLPLILEVNARVEKDRQRLLSLKARDDAGHPPSSSDERWLADLMTEYGVPDLDWTALLRRVDTVPPALALAQAASESAWGTSRFAQDGNALFGQWAWTDDAGIIPTARGDEESHVVRSFRTPLESVRAYLHNLNTHPFYKRFRLLRAELRGETQEAPGSALAETLDSYAERGFAYVEDLRTIMRVNNLDIYNKAVLDSGIGRLALGETTRTVGEN